MHNINVNREQKRIYLQMEGFLNDAEVREVVNQFIKEIDALGSNFDIINDLTAFKPASAEAAQEIQRCMKYAYDHGLRHVVRIVGPSALSQMQFKRLSRQVGTARVTEEVASREEAERRLDLLNMPASGPGKA